MQSQKPNYLSFPFPIRILVSYVLLTVVGVVLMDMLTTYLILTDSVSGLVNSVLSIGLLIIAFLVGWLVLTFAVFFLAGSKIYRGIGLYRFMTVISILCPIAFIGTVVVINLANTPCTSVNYVCLFLEFAVAPALMVSIRMATRCCDRCGLINTFKVEAVKTNSLGTEHKFHTEGGYYQKQKTTGKLSRLSHAGPEVIDVELTTNTYVPKTTVYDGQFEKKKTVTDYKCAVCGNIISETRVTETKVGGR